MKCNSCGAENSSAANAFSCAYCGAENVPQEYFDEKTSSVLEADGLSPLKEQGISNFNKKKFEAAADDLSKYLAVTSGDAEAWTFYALSEAELLKASNVDEKFFLISDAIKNAKRNNADKEFLNNSEVILSSKILGKSLDAAHVYFKNSNKRYTGFSGGQDEIRSSLAVIENAIKFPNHKSIERINILFYGIKLINIMQERYIQGGYFVADPTEVPRKIRTFIEQLEEIYEDDLSKKTIDEMLQNLSKKDRVFFKKHSPKLFGQPVKKSKDSYSKTNNYMDEEKEGREDSYAKTNNYMDEEKEGRGCWFYIKWYIYISIALAILVALFD
tara:strand:- start:1082 stop:2068 length:987 start_codon:yes stop_codon:yes gene_type:complete